MLALQKMGCQNINLVSPSHFVPQFLEALTFAAGKGLTLPVVYNTGGYDSPDTLDLLDGIVNIYMPDIKFADDIAAVSIPVGRIITQLSKKWLRKCTGRWAT